MKNNQKGITLVALVITIIVLLILAGVTIASLSGDNGILNRGKEAKISNEIGNTKDLINVGIQEGMTEFYNTKYADGATSITQNTLGAYLQVALTENTAKPVINKIDKTSGGVDDSTSVYTITTQTKGSNGDPVTATMNADGKITAWGNDK